MRFRNKLAIALLRTRMTDNGNLRFVEISRNLLKLVIKIKLVNILD